MGFSPSIRAASIGPEADYAPLAPADDPRLDRSAASLHVETGSVVRFVTVVVIKRDVRVPEFDWIICPAVGVDATGIHAVMFAPTAAALRRLQRTPSALAPDQWSPASAGDCADLALHVLTPPGDDGPAEALKGGVAPGRRLPASPPGATFAISLRADHPPGPGPWPAAVAALCAPEFGFASTTLECGTAA